MKRPHTLFGKTQWMTLACCLLLSLTQAQDATITLWSGYQVNLHNLNTICAPAELTVKSYWFLDLPPTEADLPTDLGTYHTATAGVPSTILLDIPAVGNLPGANWFLNYRVGDVLGSPPIVNSTYPVSNPPAGFVRFEIPVLFSVGTRKGYVQFTIRDTDGTGNLIYTWVAIPVTVLGPTINNQEVVAIDTIVEPQIPHLILHAPPGDGSSSKFQSSKTTCRKLETNYASEGSIAANTAVKVGVAGSAGIFVTTDFEFSVTVNAGLEVGDMTYTASSDQTCITVSEEFVTSSMLDDNGGGDVFVGYGTDLAMGAYEYYRLDQANCTTVLDTGLIYAPVGELRQFAKTTSGIQTSISELEAVVADSMNLPSKTVNDAQNQIDVWQQVLDLNQTNISNATEPMGLSFDLDATTALTRSEAIKVTEVNTITYQHYTKANLGVSTKVEVGGSGFTGGFEFKGSKRFGETQNQSDSESQLIQYTLADDDPGDNFRVQVFRDPMYGTPIFLVDEALSRSSCPYQVGYQRDQPLLQFTDGSQEIALTNIPNGESASFQIQICNDSDEPRTYHLKGNSNTNLDGLIVEGFGNNLFNTTDDGIEFLSVPANDCLNAATLLVRQSNLNIQTYEDVELYLDVICQPGFAPIRSSIQIDAAFSPVTSLDDPDSNGLLMSVTPNPNTGQFQIQLDGVMGESVLTLTDLTGRSVLSQVISAGTQTIRIQETTLSPGIYLLHLQSSRQRLTRKVVIQ